MNLDGARRAAEPLRDFAVTQPVDEARQYLGLARRETPQLSRLRKTAKELVPNPATDDEDLSDSPGEREI